MAQVLYRKYRPTSLSEVIGQPGIVTALENSLKSGKIGHAYLFIGPRGTGKTSVARIFAHAVNGFDYQVEDNYLDIIEIDAASNTGVDNIRDLREKALIAPTKGKYKVYIIDEVHMLSKSASNALLKTLEEPPEHVIFIMATTDAHKVPITISSRTQVFTFRLADPALMQSHLRQIAATEQIPIEDDALALVVKRGGGSFRDSLSLLDQVSHLADSHSTSESNPKPPVTITTDTLISALGLPQDQAITGLLTAYASGDHPAIHAQLTTLLNTGLRPETLATELIDAIIANPRPEHLSLLGSLTSVAQPFPEAKLLLALLGGPTAQSAPKPSSHQALAEKPQETPPNSPTAQNAPKSFSWSNFLDQIHPQSDALYNQLVKIEQSYENGTLHLYPATKFVKNLLDKPGNAQLISQNLHGISLLVHSPDDRPVSKDATISQISAIMGNVQDISGEQPF